MFWMLYTLCRLSGSTTKRWAARDAPTTASCAAVIDRSIPDGVNFPSHAEVLSRVRLLPVFLSVVRYSYSARMENLGVKLYVAAKSMPLRCSHSRCRQVLPWYHRRLVRTANLLVIG